MNPQSKARQLWVLKDAVGDYLEWEPTRHTSSDFIHVIEFEAYRKAVEALKFYADNSNWTYSCGNYCCDYEISNSILNDDMGADNCGGKLAKETLRELGE